MTSPLSRVELNFYVTLHQRVINGSESGSFVDIILRYINPRDECYVS